jgi:hypothetical protein
MTSRPKAVIHINFLPGELLFDPRPIWSALNRAGEAGSIPASLPLELGTKFGGTAIHIGTRDYIMRAAVRELKTALLAVYKLVGDAADIPDMANTRILRGSIVEGVRDRVLLATDSFLYEFRAFLDLTAKFAYGILAGIDKLPTTTQQLSSGITVNVADKKGRVRPHDFLLYLCDKVQVTNDWYMFLSAHRNFFTHDAAPYCAIEDRRMFPAEYDLLIMRTNILDFAVADPKDYFRVSECTGVMTGMRQFGSAVQSYLVGQLK